MEKLTIKQIAKELKQTFGTITFYIRKHELKSPRFPNRKPRTDTKIAKLTKELAIEYYINQQLSTTDIAKIFDLKVAWAISKQLKLYGIEIRNEKDRITEKVRKKLRNVIHIPTPEATAAAANKNRGRKASQEEKDRRRASQKRGPDNPFYKGNQPFIDSVRKCVKYNDWRSSIFYRDKRTCVFCKVEKKKMNVDHIKPFSFLLKENNITTIEEALICDALWDINNGRVLCVDCHKKTDTYGEGAKKYGK